LAIFVYVRVITTFFHWLSSKIATLPLSLSWQGWQGWQAVAMSPPPVLLTRKKGTACALDFAPEPHR
jgi:hypothetical protein